MQFHKAFNTEMIFPQETYDHIKSFKDSDSQEFVVDKKDMKIILEVFEILKSFTDNPTKIRIVSK